VVRIPKKPVSGRKRGRPRLDDEADHDDQGTGVVEGASPPLPRWKPDYTALETAMAFADSVIFRAK
ncbi:hypothetical protein ACF3NX_15800, partial (plasmid) [Acetobacter orientalis]